MSGPCADSSKSNVGPLLHKDENTFKQTTLKEEGLVR